MSTLNTDVNHSLGFNHLHEINAQTILKDMFNLQYFIESRIYQDLLDSNFCEQEIFSFLNKFKTFFNGGFFDYSKIKPFLNFLEFLIAEGFLDPKENLESVLSIHLNEFSKSKPQPVSCIFTLSKEISGPELSFWTVMSLDAQFPSSVFVGIGQKNDFLEGSGRYNWPFSLETSNPFDSKKLCEALLDRTQF